MREVEVCGRGCSTVGSSTSCEHFLALHDENLECSMVLESMQALMQGCYVFFATNNHRVG